MTTRPRDPAGYLAVTPTLDGSIGDARYVRVRVADDGTIVSVDAAAWAATEVPSGWQGQIDVRSADGDTPLGTSPPTPTLPPLRPSAKYVIPAGAIRVEIRPGPE